MEKNCKKCGKVFFKKPSHGMRYWAVKIYCSKSCAVLGRLVSEETKRKMSIAHKGKKLPKRTPRLILAAKICKTCGGAFNKHPTESNPHFINRDFCSNKCIHVGRIVLDSTRIKMSVARKGKKLPKRTPEQIEEFRQRQLGTKRTLETRLKQRESQLKRVSEGRHNTYRGALSDHRKQRDSLDYKIWRTAVFERDNWTCVLCKAKKQKGIPIVLNADHIKSFAYHPNLRTDINNGRTLCEDCHRMTDNFGWKAFNMEHKKGGISTITI